MSELFGVELDPWVSDREFFRILWELGLEAKWGISRQGSQYGMHGINMSVPFPEPSQDPSYPAKFQMSTVCKMNVCLALQMG